MTNRAFVPSVDRACRAQCTISSSAAKQQNETEKEKAPPYPQLLSEMLIFWHIEWEQLTQEKESTAPRILWILRDGGKKVFFICHISD